MVIKIPLTESVSKHSLAIQFIHGAQVFSPFKLAVLVTIQSHCKL